MKHFSELKQNVGKINFTMVNLKTFKSNSDFVKNEIKYIKNCISDVDINQNTTDNYLEKYLPFTIQNFISENLEAVLSKNQFSTFKRFEKLKYRHMHHI